MRLPLAILALLASWSSTAAAADEGRVERGRYLAVLGDCAGCHTNPGGKPLAGGLAIKTPFGHILASNITPDKDTGIGNWTDDEFVAALHEGRGRGGTRLYPAMPYPAYTKLTREDVLAIRAYLATLEPVANKVVANQLPFPLNIRLSMLFWNGINFTPGRYTPNPRKSVEWNRGAYIAEAAGHCQSCHTPKDILGGDKTSAPYTGATLDGWFAPDLTSNQHKGIGGWSSDELIRYLKSGANTWTLASGPMADVVSLSTSHMTDQDLAAIAVYLKDAEASASAAAPKAVIADDKTMRAGGAIYADNCAACHRVSGEGTFGLFPRLSGSALVQSDDVTTLVSVVLHGSRAVSTETMPTAPAMPGFFWRLDDAQVAAVVTYIRNSWGNAATIVPPGSVAERRAALAATR